MQENPGSSVVSALASDARVPRFDSVPRHASHCVICRDDPRNVNWRPPVHGQSSPV